MNRLPAAHTVAIALACLAWFGIQAWFSPASPAPSCEACATDTECEDAWGAPE